MGTMSEDLFRDTESEIDDALRSAPLVKPPADLYLSIMKQVKTQTATPEFHLKWMDFAVSLAGSLSVAIFLASFVFMPAPLRARAEFLLQWADYLGRISLIWVIPVVVATVIVVTAGFTFTRSERLFR